MEVICKTIKYLFSLEDIMKIIKETGFDITQMKETLLIEEEAEKIYFKIKRKAFYKDVLDVLAE